MQPTWRMRHAQSFLMYNKLTTDNTQRAPMRCEAGRVKRLSQGSLIRVMREIDNLLGLPAAATAEVFFHLKTLSIVYVVCEAHVMSSLESAMYYRLFIYGIFKVSYRRNRNSI